MRESNGLFDEEQRALKLAQRLQEQNDQLLELLLEVNDSDKIPPYFRYDLRDPIPAESEVPALSPDHGYEEGINVDRAEQALEEARRELESNLIDLATYEALETALGAIINRPRLLTKLSETSHSVLHGDKAVAPQDLPTNVDEVTPACYLSPAYEEDFYSSLDRYLESAKPDAPYMPPPLKPTDRERERDTQLHNPMSVYNWLAKHRADFAVDSKDEGEGGGGGSGGGGGGTRGEKSIRGGGPEKTNNNSNNKKPSSPKPTPAPSRGSKRDRTSTIHKSPKTTESAVAEMLDDEGFVIGREVNSTSTTTAAGTAAVIGGGGGKGKRKRGGEDEAYRPKGGSSRPSKRKRASTLKKGEKGDAVGGVEEE